MRHCGGQGCEQVGSDMMRRDGNIPEEHGNVCGRRGHQGWLNIVTNWHFSCSFHLIFLNTYDPYFPRS